MSEERPNQYLVDLRCIVTVLVDAASPEEAVGRLRNWTIEPDHTEDGITLRQISEDDSEPEIVDEY